MAAANTVAATNRYIVFMLLFCIAKFIVGQVSVFVEQVYHIAVDTGGVEQFGLFAYCVCQVCACLEI